MDRDKIESVEARVAGEDRLLTPVQGLVLTAVLSLVFWIPFLMVCCH